MIIYQLFRPVAFLKIGHKDIDSIRWRLPIIVSFILTVALCVFHFGMDVNLFSDKGFFERLFGILSILPGFFIAALAAVATFGHEDMDNYLPTPSATLGYNERGETGVYQLSKRQFISLLFSFLTFESLFLFLILAFSLPLAAIEVPMFVSSFFIVAFTFFTCTALCQLVILTMFGLYFLGDRMHRVTETETPKKK